MPEDILNSFYAISPSPVCSLEMNLSFCVNTLIKAMWDFLSCPDIPILVFQGTSTNKWIVIIGSPWWHVTEYFFMEDSEERALSEATYKPCCWSHYIGNIFVISPHCLEQLKDFLKYLNSIQYNIHLSMETNRWPPFFPTLTAKGTRWLIGSYSEQEAGPH
jgi:hypothetical protein